MTEFLLKVDVVKISCGNHHIVALTNEEQLYAWGRGNYGQLGLGNLQDWQVYSFPSTGILFNIGSLCALLVVIQF